MAKMIRACRECGYCRDVGGENLCHHPSIMGREEHGYDEVARFGSIPLWCPLEDAPEEKGEKG